MAAGQFLVVLGFASAGPFLPLYVRSLGSLTEADAAFLGGLAMAAAPIAVFGSSPLWGLLADRVGRKPMVLRAMFGSTLSLAALSFAPDVYWVIGIRFIQGLFAGTMGAASALVASLSPRGKLPFSMGLLMMGMFAGSSVGPLFGGLVADSIGFRETFLVTSSMMFLGGIIVLLLIKEEFHPTPKAQRVSLGSMFRLAGSRRMVPLLAANCVLQLGPNMLSPIIPLFIRELDPGGAAASASGVALAATGVIGGLSAWAFGRFAGQVSMKKMLFLSCMGCAATYLPPFWAASVGQLIVLIAVLGLFKGGLMTSSNSLVGLSVPEAQHGTAFGLNQSAGSLGNALGPLLGGIMGASFGLRAVFPAATVLFLVVGFAVARLLGDLPVSREEAARKS